MVAGRVDHPFSNAGAGGRRAGGSRRRVSPVLFGLLVALGLFLGGLVLIRAYLGYRYASNELLVGYLMRDAGILVLRLESRMRQEPGATPESLRRLLEEIHEDAAERIAWMAICRDPGGVATQAGQAATACGIEDVNRVLELRAPVAESHDAPEGRVLVVTIPYGLHQDTWVVGADLNVAQVALFVDRMNGPLAPLQRTLAVTVTAALALMASMVTAALWFPSFLRGRALAEQMRLAREVQQLLLPAAFPTGAEVDIAGTCVAAWDVGGDYYDAFRSRDGDLVFVVADVAGKGVAAGLLTALVHGAVHAASHAAVTEPAALIEEINELLCGRSAENRYATMFWARFDPRERSCRYVNAGHLPPLVLSQDTADGATVRRLDVGGPVVGLLPGAPYVSGTIHLRPGDVLVAYSDGLSEAENAQGEEFGDDRLISTVEAGRRGTAAEILQQILSAVHRFVGRKPVGDDLTVLVVKFR
jgi:serine phosphatase RsbU (regulator of sigma subunit)